MEKHSVSGCSSPPRLRCADARRPATGRPPAALLSVLLDEIRRPTPTCLHRVCLAPVMDTGPGSPDGPCRTVLQEPVPDHDLERRRRAREAVQATFKPEFIIGRPRFVQFHQLTSEESARSGDFQWRSWRALSRAGPSDRLTGRRAHAAGQTWARPPYVPGRSGRLIQSSSSTAGAALLLRGRVFQTGDAWSWTPLRHSRSRRPSWPRHRRTASGAPPPPSPSLTACVLTPCP